MDEKRKISSITPSEISSPVLLRRRLSAPETVMRKHSLAQQRFESQDSDGAQSDYRNYPWNGDVGSDTNLSRRKDSGLLRKSMLMRKFWNNGRILNEKNKRFYGAYSDWQYSSGKLSAGRSSYSLNSNHSSPEHIKSFRSLTGDEFRTASQSNLSPIKSSRKLSPKHMYNLQSSPRRKMSVYNNNYQDFANGNTFRSSNVNSVESSTSLRTTTTENRLSTTDTIKTTETESYTNTTTRRTGTYATSFSDNSDSAYTNSQSNFTQTSNSDSYSHTHSSQTQISTRDEQNDSTESTFRFDMSASNNNLDPNGVPDPENRHESSTQTPDTANLNVISNVQLSQSTLNLIFNQVLQDVQNKQPNAVNIKTLSATLPPRDEQPVRDGKVINVQQMPSFYLNCKEDVVINPDHNRVIKYMISNIGTGSPYSKPAEIPQVVVPRYSALPTTSSMEVNTSSDDSTDKESDTVSLVDSLEGPTSPKGGQDSRNHDDKLVRGDLSILLPDNSDKKKSKTSIKPAVFFIPIEDVKQANYKAVSELLPDKVREKLSKRQLKRELKIQQTKNKSVSPRSDSNYISASDNGNQISLTVQNNTKYVDAQSTPTLPDINSHKKKRPLIQNVRKTKTVSKDNIKYCELEKLSKPLKRKSITKYEKADISPTNKSKSWSPKPTQKSPTKLSPIYTEKNEYNCDEVSRRIYHKTELDSSSKRIEILQIMECVHDLERQRGNFKTGKSKIPVLVHQKLPKIEKKPLKPVFIEFGHVLDPKMDQLIANILIDTLNKCEDVAPLGGESSNVPSQDKVSIPTTRSNSKYQKVFEAIPEELSRHSSMEDGVAKSDKINSNSLIEEAAKFMTNQVLTNNNMSKQSNNNSVKEEISYTPKEETLIGDSKTEDNFKCFPKNNSLTIPQGWITFYMLHKNHGSPDSTSDEGTNRKENSNIQQCLIKRDKEESKADKEKSSVKLCELAIAKKERSNTLDMVSSSDAFSDNLNSARKTGNIGRKKQFLNKRMSNYRNTSQTPQPNFANGWSVTVSGTNTYGQYAPDVEMRLRFPNPQQPPDKNENDKTAEQHTECNDQFFHSMETSCHLPKRHNHQQRKSDPVADVATTEDTFRSGRLPVIQQKTNLKVSESWNSSITSSMVPVKMEPRQTKTSTRRLALNRPRHLQPGPPNFNTENFLKLTAERQLAAILHKFPGILSVNGNSINPEQKSCLNTERNLPRSLFTNPR